MEQEDNLQEFDFIDIIRTIVKGKKLILLAFFIFSILGLFVAIFTPNEYTASTIFIPQGTSSKKAGGNLGGLAALAGVNIGNGAGESGIPLNLYSEIINSIPFQKELIKAPLTIEGKKEKVTYKEYYSTIYSPGLLVSLKKYTIGLPQVILNSFKKDENLLKKELEINDSILRITSEEKVLFDNLRKQLKLLVKEEDNSVTITASMPKAVPAAELTYQAQKLLEKYIIAFKVKKSSSKLDFIKKRFTEKEKVYKRKQQQLANYQDRNKYSISARSQAKLITFQAEYDLAYNVFNELATQIETQQIQVKEDTPIFTIIKPVSVPFNKTKPNRLIILISWMFTGVFLAILFIFGKKYYKEFKNKLKTE